jgi:hypothetical protein
MNVYRQRKSDTGALETRSAIDGTLSWVKCRRLKQNIDMAWIPVHTKNPKKYR